MSCSTYFSLVAPTPAGRGAIVPAIAYALKAYGHATLGQWEAAADAARKAHALQKDPHVEFTKHISQGVVAAWCGDLPQSIGFFTQASRVFEHRKEPLLHRAVSTARLAALCKDPQRRAEILADAIADCTLVLEQRPRAPAHARFYRALCLYARQDRQPKPSAPDLESALKDLAECRDSEVEPQLLGLLETHVLMLEQRFYDAVQSCHRLLGADPESVEGYLARGLCWFHLQESEEAFADYRRALVLAPESPDVHRQVGDLLFAAGGHQEAAQAYTTALKLGGALNPQVEAVRGICYLAQGKLGPALRDVAYAVQLNPSLQKYAYVRDGLLGIQKALEGDFENAMLRFNKIMHRAPEQPPVIAMYEVLLYRGLCFFYLDQPNRALQDYDTALSIFRQLPPERTERQQALEAELHFNSCLTYLAFNDFASALALTQTLLELGGCEGAQARLEYPSLTSGLVYFLKGVCELALDRHSEARASFMQSYAHDCQWVDDFLYRQGHEAAQSFGSTLKGLSVNYGSLGLQGPRRPPPKRSLMICLYPERERMAAYLPPKTVVVQDVSFFVRPSCDWPEVRPVDLTPAVNLSLLRFAQHHELGTLPELPWGP